MPRTRQPSLKKIRRLFLEEDSKVAREAEKAFSKKIAKYGKEKAPRLLEP